MRIAIVGPPHSGKSVFLSCMFSYLQANFPSNTFYLQRACPDGEGNWSASSDQELVSRIRKKHAFDQKFMEFTINSIRNLHNHFEMVFVDCGGRISEENRQIISACTHFIVISSDKSATMNWIDFCGSICGCECIAAFESTLDPVLVSSFDETSGMGRLVGLDRNGVPDATKAVIHDLAEFIFRDRREKMIEKNKNKNLTCDLCKKTHDKSSLTLQVMGDLSRIICNECKSKHPFFPF